MKCSKIPSFLSKFSIGDFKFGDYGCSASDVHINIPNVGEIPKPETFVVLSMSNKDTITAMSSI